MTRITGQIVLLAIALCHLMACSTEHLPATHQEALGMGIVLGTSGFQHVQHELRRPENPALIVSGQVINIEGAAYVVRSPPDREIRLPLDQNTAIDRPAHVGDWIRAYLDRQGRAVFIENIDEEITWD